MSSTMATSNAKASPQNNKLTPYWTLTAQQIKDQTKSLIDQTRSEYDRIAKFKPEECSFDTVVKALHDLESQFSVKANGLQFLADVSPSKDLRDASNEAKELFEAFDIEIDSREDLFEVLRAVKDKEGSALDAYKARLLEHRMRDFVRSGLALPKDQREKVKELKNRMSQLSITYQKNLNEDTTKLEFSAEELDGVPADVLSSFKRSETDAKKILVHLKNPEVIPVLQFCRVESTRAAVERAWNSRQQQQNVPLFEEMLQLRNQAARLLGYESHAAFVLDIRMAKNTRTVFSFLDDLKTRLLPFGQKELEALIELKASDVKQPKNQVEFKAYDWNYYHQMLMQTKYQVDTSLVKEYFPVEHVVSVLLQFAQETFGFRFEKQESKNLWHEDAQHYFVLDKDSGEFVGEFYLDLFPREGKYGHFAVFPLQPTCELPDGKTRQHGVNAMVCNFPTAAPGRPALLPHDDVVTLFHEFGHLQHGFASKAKYARFAGTSVERDFVECPSQMMENFCYEKEFLRRLSKHYETGQPLPDDLIDKIIAAKNANIALFNLRQLTFGYFDMMCHTAEEGKVDSAELYARLRREVALIASTPGTNFAGSFSHLMGGYDAGYYGYLFSEVYACDVFSVFKQQGLFSQDIGKRYRRTILEHGGMKDGGVILREFLQREPSSKAFMESIGLSDN